MYRPLALGAWLAACGLFGPLRTLAHGSTGAPAHDDADERLPQLGPATPFSLIDQSGQRLALAELRGKVVVLTFIFTTCTDTCPILTARLAALQAPLGAAFGPRLRFVSISVEPEVDTPEVLHAYARTHGADLRGWSFLTGRAGAVQAAVRGYGSYARRRGTGEIDHLTLTSLIDRRGRLRVQYLGTRFRDDEMLRDLHALLAE
ncbi:SCO family protein [Leptothrix cholodnii]|uniref:SCO family protein n=1 Tax=Leptothrix cholodnii TaxID=34029 RepID=UPI00167F7F1D|nr:SCO family protein [Leptothrix cholodnii]